MQSGKEILCTNCGCGLGIPPKYVETLTGSTCHCHCGHVFEIILYSEILQHQTIDWPDECLPNNPRIDGTPTYFLLQNGERFG